MGPGPNLCAKTVRANSLPATSRLMYPAVAEKVKERMRASRWACNWIRSCACPVGERFKTDQSGGRASRPWPHWHHPRNDGKVQKDDLSGQFLAKRLPGLWREVSLLRCQSDTNFKQRCVLSDESAALVGAWRTCPDPFEDVWPQVPSPTYKMRCIPGPASGIRS